MVEEVKFKYVRSLTLDERKKRSPFEVTRAIERDFVRQLKKVARASSNLVKIHVDKDSIVDAAEMLKSLSDYARKITPWAARKSFEMINRVNVKNKTAWKTQARLTGKALKVELAEAHTGIVARKLMQEQVALITSIPTEAGERAQKLAMEAMTGGRRAEEVAAELERTNEVTASRATLIARTEVARSNSSLNQARALSVGSSQYIWRTAGDADVRESHAEMDGTIQSWDDAPTLSDGTKTHPGEIYNCRCYAESVIPE